MPSCEWYTDDAGCRCVAMFVTTFRERHRPKTYTYVQRRCVAHRFDAGLESYTFDAVQSVVIEET